MLGARAENQRVEILYEDAALQATVSGSFIAEKNGIQEIQIQPDIVAEYGIAHWEVRVLAGTEPVKILKGADDLKGSYNIYPGHLGKAKSLRFPKTWRPVLRWLMPMVTFTRPLRPVPLWFQGCR